MVELLKPDDENSIEELMSELGAFYSKRSTNDKYDTGKCYQEKEHYKDGDEAEYITVNLESELACDDCHSCNLCPG